MTHLAMRKTYDKILLSGILQSTCPGLVKTVLKTRDFGGTVIVEGYLRSMITEHPAPEQGQKKDIREKAMKYEKSVNRHLVILVPSMVSNIPQYCKMLTIEEMVRAIWEISVLSLRNFYKNYFKIKS